MHEMPHSINKKLVASLTAGMLVLPAFFALAQTADQFKGALTELSALTGEEVSTKDQARLLCNQEKFITECADIGKRHNLYKPERLKQVDSVLEELKGDVVRDLKRCSSTECLVNVASTLATRFAQKDSAVARELDLVADKIQEKRIIVETAKEIGVDYDVCRTMDPDTASVEILRSCARLAKHERIQRYIPEEVKRAAEFSDKASSLDEALKRGEYQCGNNTATGCGNFCLNPSVAARGQGTAAIAPVCRELATRFFGPDGIKQLENAYTNLEQTAVYYKKRAENLTFITPEGRTLTDPAAIGQYLEEQGRKGNVEAVDKGLDFMIANGFAKLEDKKFVLKIVQKARERGGIPDFDACSQNVSLCRDFIPEEQRQEFDGFQEVEKILAQELGFNPRDCQRGEFDESIGTRCFEGSKRALGQIEALAAKNPAIGHIVADIRQHVARGETLITQKDQFRQDLQQGEGGPGGCRSAVECRGYCTDPSHGPECIAFGAQKQIAGFKGEDAVRKFQDFNQTLQRPTASVEASFQFPGQGPFPGFVPPGQGGFPPGQVPGFTAPGPGFGQPSFGQPSGFGQGFGPPGGGFPGPGGGGFGPGPSPECFKAIQTGDFVRAKEFCAVQTGQTGYATPTPRPASTCPDVFPAPCSEGQYRQESRDQNGCFNFGECVPVPGYQPERRALCPALPSVEQCPTGERKVVNFSSPECGTYYGCVRDDFPAQSPGASPFPFPTGSTYPTVSPYPTFSPYTSPYPTSSTYPAYSPYPTYSPYTSPTVSPVTTKPSVDLKAYPDSATPNLSDGPLTVYYGTSVVVTWSTQNVSSCTASGNWPNFSGIKALEGRESTAPNNAGTYTATLTCTNGQEQGSDSMTITVTTTAASPSPISGATPSPLPGACTKELITLLGDGCHEMIEGYFNGAMTRYVRKGTSLVKECSAEYVAGCTAGSSTVSPTPYPTYSPAPTYTPYPSPTYSPTATYSPAPIYSPTATYSPTPFPTPSPTPAPTVSPTPIFSPVSFLRYSCPAGHYFDGRFCVVTEKISFVANIGTSLKQAVEFIGTIFGLLR